MDYNPLLEGLNTTSQPPPFALFIFGVTGDLTRKKLIPALFSLFASGNITRFKIIGFARRGWTQDVFRNEMNTVIQRSDFSDISGDVKRLFLSQLDYIQSSFDEDTGYREILPKSKEYSNRLYYLATPPAAYPVIIDRLGKHGLAEKGREQIRIIIEKPFGKDLATARELNIQLAERFEEKQVYRIDHYLGKETVQNIMLLRFGNSIFEPLWNNRHIDHVQITVAEKMGIGTRGQYYEKAGTLRDMVQNHMFQLLSLTAMEPPNNLNPDTIRTEKVKILEALHPITFTKTGDYTVRGQYSDGIVDGNRVPAYRGEDGVDHESRTETYVALKLYLDTWRWSGVPFYLRSGKRLSRRVSEISIHFKRPPFMLFPGGSGSTPANNLIIRIQPEEGVTINMNAKIPGYALDKRQVNMDFSYGSAFGDQTPEAYERLLLDSVLGDSTLYTRRDEIEASWTFITRILSGWEKAGRQIYPYIPGSAGPVEAEKLLSDEGRRWRKL